MQVIVLGPHIANIKVRVDPEDLRKAGRKSEEKSLLAIEKKATSKHPGTKVVVVSQFQEGKPSGKRKAGIQAIYSCSLYG